MAELRTLTQHFNIYYQNAMKLLEDCNKNRDPSRILCNVCYGGFCFSDEFLNTFKQRYNYDDVLTSDFYNKSVRRDKRVLDLFEEFGSKRASGCHSELRITQLPLEFDNEYICIEDDDGFESVSFYYISDKTSQFIDAIERGEVIDKNHPIYLSYLKHKNAYNTFLNK